MEKNEDFVEYDQLPLKYVYLFLEEKGFGEESELLQTTRESYKSYTSTLKRAMAINYLDGNDLLNEFIEEWWPNGKTSDGRKHIRRYRNLYNKYTNRELEEDEEEIDRINETSFAYEEDLRDYLANNLYVIEKGLKLYQTEEGIDGVEYQVDARNKRIDIFAIDKDEIPVVIELKVSKGYERVIGQCLYYKNRVLRKFDADRVRIIIIAREITEHLKIATDGLEDVELYEYELSISLNKID